LQRLEETEECCPAADDAEEDVGRSARRNARATPAPAPAPGQSASATQGAYQTEILCGEGELKGQAPQLGAVDAGDAHVELNLLNAADAERVDNPAGADDGSATRASNGARRADHALGNPHDHIDVLGVGHGP